MYKYYSNAKINIGLQVLGLRDDNYHEINTLFMPICLADELTIELSKELSVKCKPDLKINQENNIVYQAAKLIQKSFDCKSKGAKITINKKIPVGGGLGGGSSNAATVIKALNDLWQINAPISKLREISLQLGSDVPFFFNSSPAIAKGRGELMELIDFSIPYHLLLIFPGIQVNTGWAYKNIDPSNYSEKGFDYKKFLSENNNIPQLWKKFINNDFEPIVFREHPILQDIKSQLYNCGAVYSSMSGSGSTIYGFFSQSSHIEKAKKNLSKFRNHECLTTDYFISSKK